MFVLGLKAILWGMKNKLLLSDIDMMDMLGWNSWSTYKTRGTYALKNKHDVFWIKGKDMNDILNQGCLNPQSSHFHLSQFIVIYTVNGNLNNVLKYECIAGSEALARYYFQEQHSHLSHDILGVDKKPTSP